MEVSGDDGNRGRLLLSQLDLIFSCDPLIDELGFVHATQLTSLHSSDDSKTKDFILSKFRTKNSSGSKAVSTGGDESHSQADCSRKTEHGVEMLESLDDNGATFNEGNGDGGLPYDPTAFWYGDHKLAIAMHVLGPIYKCAKAVLTSTRTDYKKLLQAEEGDGVTEGDQNVSQSSLVESHVKVKQGGQAERTPAKVRLEDMLMSYSRALVLINCDHATAWNTRRQIILNRGSNQETLSRELHLAGVVMSCGPKSEEAWAYRRWVINQMISGGVLCTQLDALLDGESKLVEAVAGRSRMNYRAWRHRCWLVSQMSFLQVAIELHKTKLWANSHVTDNCVFHYRRCLLLQLVKSKLPESDQISPSKVTALKKELDMKNLEAVLMNGPETRVIWKDETDWIKKLIQQYIGREALWIHLRFLFISWTVHVGPTVPCPYWAPGPDTSKKVPLETNDGLLSMEDEEHFVDCCIHACSSNLSEEGDRQREYAAAYRLWISTTGSSQQMGNRKNGILMTDGIDLTNLKQLLYDGVPHRKQLWDGLFTNSDLHLSHG